MKLIIINYLLCLFSSCYCLHPRSEFLFEVKYPHTAMGIKDLSKVAVDASMCLYQFLVAVRQDGSQLQNADGETTSHLMGIFYRTISMIENGIKPVYVFDGKPPDMKSGELQKRAQRREDTEKQLKEAEEEGDTEAVQKFERRLVKVTKEHNEEVKKLLRLMGIPIVEAPCEAEAQCAQLVRSGKVYGTATEDMDALTFGSNILLRNMTASEAKKLKVKEIHLARVLEAFEMTMEEFVDLCIMLGCDYCGTIRGVGPKKAFELIKKYSTIETVLENLDTTKYPPPSEWPYKRARELFVAPEVTKGSEIELEWKDADVEGVVAYMSGEKNFEEQRIRSALTRMAKGRQNSSQGRIDSFFTTAKLVKVETPSTVAAKKRKVDEKEGKKRGPAKKFK